MRRAGVAARFAATRMLGRVRMRGMECMDEFDPEVPLRVTYCHTLSQEEFEEQASVHTSAALAELSRTLAQQPQLHARTLRRRRQEQAEEAGVFSFIKAKFYLLVQGENNECSTVGDEELQREIEALREKMNRAFEHAQEAKDGRRRFSKRLAEKQTNCMPPPTTAPPPTALPPLAPPPTAPPPPPPAPPLPKAQVPLRERTNPMANAVAQTPELLKSYGLTSLNKKRSVGDTKTLRNAGESLAVCAAANWQDELVSSLKSKRLKTTGAVRSPGGTPADAAVKGRDSIHNNMSPASTIKAALITKFQNVSSPASSDRSWYSLNGSFL
ncbi:unnamed protein product [Lampetra fluviatilis]